MKKLPTGSDLENRCFELGIKCDGTAGRYSEYIEELQNRIMEVAKHDREHRIWIIALISAIASVLSARTTLIALYLK